MEEGGVYELRITNKKTRTSFGRLSWIAHDGPSKAGCWVRVTDKACLLGLQGSEKTMYGFFQSDQREQWLRVPFVENCQSG